MIKIKSIKELKKHLRNIAEYNAETFDLPDFHLKTIRRMIKYEYKTTSVPHIALKKCEYFIETINDVHHQVAYEFDKNICRTKFIVENDDEDTIVKVDFHNDAHRSDTIVSVQRLHKYVADLLDSTVEHNFEEVKDERPYHIRYQTVTTSTDSDSVLAKSKEDAIKRITERYSSRDDLEFTLLNAEELSLSESA